MNKISGNKRESCVCGPCRTQVRGPPGDSLALPFSTSSILAPEVNFEDSICCSMASTMGTIMAVAAVLLIHIDRKAVTPIKPIISL